MPRAALFDMDKTLIRVNSARLFTQYRREKGEVGFAASLRVSLWLLRYWFGFLDAQKVAEKALEEYRNTKESDMIAVCRTWFDTCVKQHISQAARDAVEIHRRRGDVLIIASSSTPYTTRPLQQELGMHDVVSSELAVADGLLTGKVIDPVCYGPGKLHRVKQKLDELGLDINEATFYSDSITDLPLLNAVGTAVAINPDWRLLHYAKKRGFRIEKW
jgi:HAD superfamily hydrolase (TIGR01490 family)